MATAWFVVRFLAVTVGFAVLHGYLWWRLCRDTTKPGSAWRPIGAIVLGVLAVFGLLARFLTPSDAPIDVQAAVGYPGLIWFGVFLYLFGLLVVTEPLRWFLLRRMGVPAEPAPWAILRNRLRQWLPHRRERADAKRAEAPDAKAAEAAAEPTDQQISPTAAPEPEPAGPADPSANAGNTSHATPGAAAATSAAPGNTSHATAGEPPAAAAAEPAPENGASAAPGSTSHVTGHTRRRVVSRAIGLGATALAVATVGHGLYEGYRTPPLKPVTVRLERLDRRFDGYRIAVVGDTHFSAIRGREYCERVVEQIDRAQADLIAFVGDLASNEADQVRDAVDPLAGLEARDGTFFVAGNAEHYVGADEWYDRVAELGMHGLPNTRVELPAFDLAGVNDLIVDQRGFESETGPDFEAALGDRDPNRPVVFMAHQPNAVDYIGGYGVDLQLSGHTHGGQMWPVHYASLIRSGQLTGLERHGDTQVYVTNGAGTNGPPIRVGADADITVMTLRAGN